MSLVHSELQHHLSSQVAFALAEDVGSGDITAQLIPLEENITATIISRENAILCGQAWAEEVFSQLDESVKLTWFAKDGDNIKPDQVFLQLSGNARSILTGERCALNFLQTLSYTATITRNYTNLVADTELTLLDTRKTIPGLRLAQKYAVTIGGQKGGAKNHRIGLYDAFLIKENHIMACGSIKKAVETAKKVAPGKTVEVETETIEEVEQAVEAGADIIMLDNFTTQMMKEVVTRFHGQAKFEASGNMTKESLLKVASTGVDFVSIGALTKHVQAIDMSLRVIKENK